MKVLAAIVLILLTYFGISIATIIKNGVSLRDDPGVISRLKIFLSSNRAETADDAIFDELKTPIYQASIDDLIAVIQQTATDKNWSLDSNSSSSTSTNELRYIVTTPLMNFKDDISISITPIETNLVSLHITSQSRVGRADFGANLSHITQLIKALDNHFQK